jgi:hypothetical protein
MEKSPGRTPGRRHILSWIRDALLILTPCLSSLLLIVFLIQDRDVVSNEVSRRLLQRSQAAEDASRLRWRKYLKRRVTVEQAEAANLVRDDRPVPLAFGGRNRDWWEFLSEMEPGDELWEYSRPPGRGVCGGEGYALVREGAVVRSFCARFTCSAESIASH